MGFIVFVGVITVIFERWWLWMLVTIIHVVTALLFSLHVYFWGTWKLSRGNDGQLGKACLDILKSVLFPCRKLVNPLAVFVFVANLSNWLLAIIGFLLFYPSQNIQTHLLMLFVWNLILYTTTYGVLKLWYMKEKIPTSTWIYFIVSLLFWVGGLYLFLWKTTAGWEKSQAESREMNEECTFLSFYDYHGIWHFLSAFGMFFMFLVSSLSSYILSPYMPP